VKLSRAGEAGSIGGTSAARFTAAAQELLRRQREPVFAALDAARDDGVLRLLRGAPDAECQSLYDGAEGERLAGAAPYLVRLPRSGTLLGEVVAAGWGASWGIFLSSDAPFVEVRRQLRRFLLVELDDRREVYFRFYDPRVLRVFLPTCTPKQALEFFGPIQSFLAETSSGDGIAAFTRDMSGSVRTTVTALAPDAG
jgi:hypothetical protein